MLVNTYFTGKSLLKNMLFNHLLKKNKKLVFAKFSKTDQWLIQQGHSKQKQRELLSAKELPSAYYTTYFCLTTVEEGLSFQFC